MTVAEQTDLLAQSFYVEQLTKTMLRQPEAVQTAFAKIVGKNPSQRRTYYKDKIQNFIDTFGQSDLWGHQKQDIKNAQSHIVDEQCESTAITVIPTSGGKTRIFQEEANALAVPVEVKGRAVRVTPRIIQLFPTNQLIRQTKKKYVENFPALKVGDSQNIQPLTLMTYDLFEEWAAEGKIRPGDIDMLVMDEAHRGLSDNRQEAIRPFLNTCVVRAFTATPVFDSEKNVFTLLGKENEVSRFSYDELINAGHIAPIVNPILKIRINGTLPGDAEERKKLLRGLFEEELLKFYLTFQDEKTGQRLFGRPFAGYVNTIERAKEMAEYFDAEIRNAIRDNPSLASLIEKTPIQIAEHISGNHSVAEQDGLIERIKNGKTLGVFNDKWMMEGTDIPNLGATLRSPTSSLVVEVQSGGRAGRINPEWPIDDPRQTSFVVDVCFEVNGKVIGNPRFFFEAINAPSIARITQTPIINIGGPGIGKIKREGSYDVLDPRVEINRLLKSRDERVANRKPDGYWSAEEFGNAIKESESNIQSDSVGRKIISDLYDQYQIKEVATYLDVLVPKEAIALYEYNGIQAKAIRIEEAKSIIAARAMRELGVPEGFWSAEMLGRELAKVDPNINAEYNAGRYVIKNIKEQLENDQITHAIYHGIPVSREALKQYEVNGMLSDALREEECKAIVVARAAAQKELTEGYWAGPMLGDAIKEVDSSIEDPEKFGRAIISRIRGQHKNSEIAVYRGTPVPLSAIREYRSSQSSTGYALREEECLKIVSTFAQGVDKGPPEGYWPSSALGEAIGKVNTKLKTPVAVGRAIFKNIKTQLAQGDLETATYRGISIPREAVKTYSYNSTPASAIREQECNQIVETYREKTEEIESGTREEFKAPAIIKKDLKPGGEDLKRTGRSRVPLEPNLDLGLHGDN